MSPYSGLTFDTRRAASVFALGVAVAALSGCALLIPPQGGSTPSPTRTTPSATQDPSDQAVLDAMGRAKNWDEGPSTISIAQGEVYAVLLGPANASLGQYFYVVDASVDPAIADAHTEMVSDRVPDNQEGVGGDCYLIIKGGAPGSTRVKVVYCWRSQPDSAGTCDQSERTTPGQLMEHEFTVEVR